jgi:hypothetical protein
MDIPITPFEVKLFTGGVYGGRQFTIYPREIENHIRQNQRIEIIKIVRMMSGLGLNESKTLVDNACFYKTHPNHSPLWENTLVLDHTKTWKLICDLAIPYNPHHTLNNDLLAQIRNILDKDPANPISALQGVLNQFRPKYKKLEEDEAMKTLENYPAGAEYPKPV